MVEEKQVDWTDLIAFARRRAALVFARALVSLGAVACLAALYWTLAPRQESWRSEVEITLQSRDGRIVYPNGAPFGSRDLVSAPVLGQVWRELGLEARVPFDRFAAWFSFVGYDRERMKLDAEFQAKMSKRNATVSDLAALQKDYEAKLAALQAHLFALSMRPDCRLNRDEAVKILAAVPEAWFREYGRLNAASIPPVMRAEAIRAYVKRLESADGRALELVDSIRRHLGELVDTCRFVREDLLRGRNAVIDGVDVGAYEAKLSVFATEMLRFKNLVLSNGNKADLDGYVASRLDDMACEKLDLEGRIEAVRQTIDLLNEGSSPNAKEGRAGAVRASAPSSADATPVTLQADGGFFQDFAAMVRRDSNRDQLERYAAELTGLRKRMAELAARQLYYDQIDRYVNKQQERKGPVMTQEKFHAAVDAFIADLLDTSAKIVAFRDAALSAYRTSDQFYVQQQAPFYGRTFMIPFPRALLALLALWGLANAAWLVRLWASDHSVA